MPVYDRRPPSTARKARAVWDLAVERYGEDVRGIFFPVSDAGCPMWGIDVRRSDRGPSGMAGIRSETMEFSPFIQWETGSWNIV